MAETADILTAIHQKVYLPDMRAGCSMADMANIDQTDRGLGNLAGKFGETIIPLTYVNSTAAIKRFVGKNGGATVTSSNAQKMVEWAFEQKERILFLPDQHLGRNTAFDLGVPFDEMAVWDPIPKGLNTKALGRYQSNFCGKATAQFMKILQWKILCRFGKRRGNEYYRPSGMHP